MMKFLLPFTFLLVTVMSCQDKPGTPKPRAYPRVEYPEHSMQSFSNEDCPFTFQFPKYAEVQMKEDHPCWFDLFMPVFHARLHCSYLPVSNRAEFDDMVQDAFVIANKINERANFMQDSLLNNAQGVRGLALKFSGPAASPLHFFLTDSTTHFFRASLYFEAEVKPDSLRPIITFVEEDVNQMIQSFAWKKVHQ